MTEATCSIEGCTRIRRSNSCEWCQSHYMRWWRYGDPEAPLTRNPKGIAEEWLLDHYQNPDAHFDWPFKLSSTGYTTVSAHRIVAELVHGPAPEGMQAAHSCRNRHCYYAEHISWKTPAENSGPDKVRGGTAMQGEKHHRAKLTAEQVREIRSSTGLSQRALAKKYGVTRWTIKGVLAGTAWKHV